MGNVKKKGQARAVTSEAARALGGQCGTSSPVVSEGVGRGQQRAAGLSGKRSLAVWEVLFPGMQGKR